jgi:8-oxo-dGTP pyrophosphatase MutT (NUDIX family)
MRTVVIARVLVFNGEGKLLLLRRSKTDIYRPGELDWPGGGVEPSETVVEGALRELREEAGIELGQQDLQPVYTVTNTGHNSSIGAPANMVRVFFAASVKNPVILLSDEHDDYGWHTLDEAARHMENYPTGRALTNYLRDNQIADELWGN